MLEKLPKNALKKFNGVFNGFIENPIKLKFPPVAIKIVKKIIFLSLARFKKYVWTQSTKETERTKKCKITFYSRSCWMILIMSWGWENFNYWTDSDSEHLQLINSHDSPSINSPISKSAKGQKFSNKNYLFVLYSIVFVAKFLAYSWFWYRRILTIFIGGSLQAAVWATSSIGTS